MITTSKKIFTIAVLVFTVGISYGDMQEDSEKEGFYVEKREESRPSNLKYLREKQKKEREKELKKHRLEQINKQVRKAGYRGIFLNREGDLGSLAFFVATIHVERRPQEHLNEVIQLSQYEMYSTIQVIGNKAIVLIAKEPVIIYEQSAEEWRSGLTSQNKHYVFMGIEEYISATGHHVQAIALRAIDKLFEYNE